MKKETEKAKGLIKEFKEFISKGNVVDMAVGVIIGSAFGKIVSSLVNDIFMPLIGVIIGGMFIQNIIDFLIVALCVFIFVKIINKLHFKKKEETVKEEPKKDEKTLLLEEIRDLLKKNNK